jgi:Helix-turn-helix domain/AraC-like ligand binding domain
MNHPIKPSPSFFPIPESLGCMHTALGESYGWHTHPFDELCLVDGTSTTIGHASQQYRAEPGWLFLFRRGESHGYWNSTRQSARLWVIHFYEDPALYAVLPALVNDDPAKRIWRLSSDQAQAFKALHLKITMEPLLSAASSAIVAAAQSAWLRLLLIAVGRWDRATTNPTHHADDAQISSRFADGDLLQMWQIIQSYSGAAGGLVRELKSKIANYDSLRHRFRHLAGDSPTRLWSRLRLHQAKNLLLESSMSVKEIAAKTGFSRQHEFARAFRRQFGCSPSGWRTGKSAS